MTELIEELGDSCCGCLACFSVCPQEAISIKLDDLGFEYPNVDESKCIHCGLCVEACPQITEVESSRLSSKIYGAICRDTQILENSSSGGIASLIGLNFVNRNQIYYGTGFDGNGNLVVKRCTTKKDVESVSGSKYVQSTIGTVLKQIKEDLQNNKEVVFVGTPCQCACIKRNLYQLSEKMYLVSFPCGGVASKKIMNDEVYRLTKSKDFYKIVMRIRRSYFFDIYTKSDVKRCEGNFSLFTNAFEEKVSTRKSCWKCSYSNDNRVEDLIVGDFWGAERIENSVFDKNEIRKGISFISALNIKGERIIELIGEGMLLQEVPKEMILSNNPRLQESMIYDKQYCYKKRIVFEESYKSRGFTYATIMSLKLSFIRRVVVGVVKYKILRKKRVYISPNGKSSKEENIV